MIIYLCTLTLTEIYGFLLLFCSGHILTFSIFFLCVLFSLLLTAVNICVPHWVAGSDGSGFLAAFHIFFLCDLLFVKSVHGK